MVLTPATFVAEKEELMTESDRDHMVEYHQLALAITEKLKHEGPCVCESLLAKFSLGAWNGAFAVIDACRGGQNRFTARAPNPTSVLPDDSSSGVRIGSWHDIGKKPCEDQGFH